MTSYSQSPSISSFDLSTDDAYHEDKPDLNIVFSSSSGYDSSFNSMSDQLSSSSSDSSNTPDCNFVGQVINLQRQRQSLYDRNISPLQILSLSFLSSSSISQEQISSINSCIYCPKSNDAEDDSQLGTISTSLSSIQRGSELPRSLPIAIQQPKRVFNDDETDSSSPHNFLYPYSINESQKKRFRTCEVNAAISTNGRFSENDVIITSFDQLHVNEPMSVNPNNSLEHFIISRTDKVKLQMKYQESSIKKNATIRIN